MFAVEPLAPAADVGGLLNQAIMRTIDIFYAFPSVLLAVAISGVLGAASSTACCR